MMALLPGSVGSVGNRLCSALSGSVAGSVGALSKGSEVARIGAFLEKFLDFWQKSQ